MLVCVCERESEYVKEKKNPWATREAAVEGGLNHLHLSHPSIKPDTQQNYVLLFCSSWIKAVKEEEKHEVHEILESETNLPF